MARDRLKTLAAMMDQGVIPVFYHPDVEVCAKVIQACANGGDKCIEFTNRGDFAPHTFLDVTRHFAKADDSVIMGVGSVVDAPNAGLYIANGANFVVGPMTNPEVARVCNRRGIAYSPGSAVDQSGVNPLTPSVIYGAAFPSGTYTVNYTLISPGMGAHLVQQLVANRHEARRLQDLVVVAVHGRDHHAGDALRDAPFEEVEIFGAVERSA